MQLGRWFDAHSLLVRLSELVAVASVAVAWPILDSFGDSPETFVARRAATWEIVAFALVVFAGPPLLLLAIDLLVPRTGLRGTHVHEGLVALVGGIAVVRWMRATTAAPPIALAVGGVVSAAVVATTRAHAPEARMFTRFAGVASLAYLAGFLFVSPTASMMLGRQEGADDVAGLAIAAGSASQVTPVVVVVLDALPTVSLLDGNGGIDASLAPNIAQLVEDATWYRNHSTVSGWTLESLGVMTTGTYPASEARRSLGSVQQHNLFTLLAGGHDMHVYEPVTRLCPRDVCPQATGGALAALLGDAASMWWPSGALTDDAYQTLPAGLGRGRLGQMADWVDALPLAGNGRPDLVFLHALLPHDPFHFLPDGRSYHASDPPIGIHDDVWSDDAAAHVARQRHLLQVGAADALVGHLIDRLRDSGVYDDAMIVVTADHGVGFTVGQPSRRLTNGQFEQILWTPLVVKAPHQRVGEVSDQNIETVDILPTIAAGLGADLPWDTDGLAAGGPDQRAPSEKEVMDWPGNQLGSAGDDGLVDVDAMAGFGRVLRSDPTPASGPYALWQSDEVPIVGQRIEDLEVDLDIGEEVEVELTIDGLDRFDHVDASAPLPLEVTGRLSASDQQRYPMIALVLNGMVAAVTEPSERDGRSLHALLLPGPFREGRNELEAFVVGSGLPPEMRPLPVERP